MFNNLAYGLEDLHTRAEELNSLQLALFAALFCQEEYTPGNFKFAFMLLGHMVFKIECRLKELTDEAFELLKKEDPT